MLKESIHSLRFMNMPIGTVFKNEKYINMKVSNENNKMNVFCLSNNISYSFSMSSLENKYPISNSELVIKE